MKSVLLITISIIISINIFAASSSKHLNLKGKEMISDLTGTQHSLKDLTSNGKTTIITFFSVHCGVCVRELDAIQSEYQYFQDSLNADLVAITVDGKKANTEVDNFSKEKAWSFNIMNDVDREAIDMFDVRAIPYMIILDKYNNVVFENKGFKPTDVAKIKEVLATVK